MYQLEENCTEEKLIECLKFILNDKPELFSKRQNDCGCFFRALRLGEPTFTLRAQDQTSPLTINEWLVLNPQLSDERRGQTLERMGEMESWPTKKAAD